MLLLNCQGKFIVNVITELLSDDAQSSAPISEGQFGSSRKRMAIEERARIVDSAHVVRKDDLITGILLMKISAVFPCRVTGRWSHALNGWPIDEEVVRWTESFHSERTV